ncbi:hypothetical protein PEC18_29625 [Paucibacter sp. O1-1]|nr:hypothetical protein [Paucibacter sp. O1-1]MCU7374899.1 hypothetical protein [Paucibacter sp. O1-1]MDA3829895.1 hypothetical protein [Paucibacter sp. O1-1]MDA3829901.1 hypothetical protein [Paucibacter sp. O1-1]
MLARKATLLLSLLPLAALASPSESCRELNRKAFDSNVFYIVAFVGTEGQPTNPQERRAKVGQLETSITSKLNGYTRNLAKDIGDVQDAPPPLLMLITCEMSVKADDLNRREIESLSQQNVISALWTSKEGTAATITQISLPHFKRQPTAARWQIEILWKMAATPTASVDDWRFELERDSVAQQALLAMNIGFMALQAGQLPLAKRSLCQARRNMKLMGAEIVRPDAVELQRVALAMISDVISEVDRKASSSGINLNTSLSLKSACL